jgi:putative IMPACT (imprinted ancient) family translation regulator
VQQEIFDEIILTFTYEQTSLLSYLIQKYEAKVIEEQYNETIQQKLLINRGLTEAFKHELFEKSNGSLTC